MAEALTAGSFNLPHGFFTRRGGVSSGAYASLNCSLSSQDDPERIRQNRARVAASIGVAEDRLLGLTQVHGTDVVTVREPWAIGHGERADAMVTDQRDLALGVVTADCAPVLFAARNRTIVGAAHAGWRGAVAGVLEATIGAMAALGASASAVCAVVGPCIGQASYEVGPDLRDAVLARSAEDERFFAPGRQPDRWQFDLSGYCASRLESVGVGQVIVIGRDTFAEEDNFFSHRRRTLGAGGPIGHQISVIRPA